MTSSSPDLADSGRALTPQGLRALHERFSTEDGVARARAFVPRPSDVFVATYSKSGTTLLQQIVHGLRTKGDMDFRDISEVVPWIEVAHDLGQDLDAEQKAEPRAFKTHFDGDSLPKGGRVVYVVREPISALVSFYHFNSGWFMEPGAMNLERFALERLLGRLRLVGHVGRERACVQAHRTSLSSRTIRADDSPWIPNDAVRLARTAHGAIDEARVENGATVGARVVHLRRRRPVCRRQSHIHLCLQVKPPLVECRVVKGVATLARRRIASHRHELCSKDVAEQACVR